MTTGVEIAGDLLAGDAAFVALVPEPNFDYWELPQGTGLPSVVLEQITRTERQFLDAQPMVMVTERVQATVRAGSGAKRKAVLDAIRDAWRDKRPKAAGVLNVAVLLVGDGPQMKTEDGNIYMGSTDARVSFTAPT